MKYGKSGYLKAKVQQAQLKAAAMNNQVLIEVYWEYAKSVIRFGWSGMRWKRILRTIITSGSVRRIIILTQRFLKLSPTWLIQFLGCLLGWRWLLGSFGC